MIVYEVSLPEGKVISVWDESDDAIHVAETLIGNGNDSVFIEVRSMTQEQYDALEKW